MLLGGWRVSWWSVSVGAVGVGAGRGLRLGGPQFWGCHSWLVVAVLLTVLARAPPAELWAMSKARALQVLPCTYDFSSRFFPKFNKSAKRGFSREMTYFFGFYGPKIGGGGVHLPDFCPKKLENPEIWPILGYFCLLWAGPAEQCCTPVYLPIEDFRQKFQFSLDSLAPK